FRILEPQQIISLVVTLGTVEITLRKALDLVGGKREPGFVVADIASELLAYRLEPLEDGAHPRALVRRQCDARILERLQNVAAHLDRRGPSRRSRLDACVQALVLKERGIEALDLLLACLAGGTRLFVGRDIGEQRCRALDI